MWRQVVQKRSASTARCYCARHQNKPLGARSSQLIVSAASVSQHDNHRSFSSAQPSSWDDHNHPFAMSSAPSLSQMHNPTAERVVMKTFLNTLKVSAVCGSDAVETEFHSEENVIEESMRSSEEEWPLKVIEEEQTTSLVVVSSSVASDVPEQEMVQDSIESFSDSSEMSDTHQQQQAPVVQKKNPSHGRLVHAIRTNNPEKAKFAFRECLQKDVTVSRRYLVQLFNVVVSQDPVTAFAVLKQYRVVTGEPATSALYARLCQEVGTVPWQLAHSGQFTKMINDLLDELVSLEEEDYQKRCFPIILVSLIQQPMHRVGRIAKGVYSFMDEKGFKLSYGKMCHILNLSRYTRQDDLSFPTILSRLVEEGMRKCRIVLLK